MGSRKEQERARQYEQVRETANEARSGGKVHERNKAIAWLVKRVLDREGHFCKVNRPGVSGGFIA